MVQLSYGTLLSDPIEKLNKIQDKLEDFQEKVEDVQDKVEYVQGKFEKLQDVQEQVEELQEEGESKVNNYLWKFGDAVRMSRCTSCSCFLLGVTLLVCILGGYFMWIGIMALFHNGPTKLRSTPPNHPLDETMWSIGATDSKVMTTPLPMPDGVNIGSWLSLEDYFFAGDSAVEVATPDGSTAAVCLPPLHTGSSTGPTWNAETDLLQQLTTKTTLGHALKVFHAHRNTFLDFDEDLEVLKQLGIHSIRIPLSWCLTDEDPSTIDPHDTDIASLEERFTCLDPFFDSVRWPASKSILCFGGLFPIPWGRK